MAEEIMQAQGWEMSIQPTLEGEVKQRLSVIIDKAQQLQNQCEGYGNEQARQMAAKLRVIVEEGERIVKLVENKA